MIEINILEAKWKVYIMDEEQYITEHSDADAAHTIPALNEIVFNESELNLIVVKHELWHAWRASLCTTSADLTADQEEEISAELFSHHGDKINRMARTLYKELKSGDWS